MLTTYVVVTNKYRDALSTSEKGETEKCENIEINGLHHDGGS